MKDMTTYIKLGKGQAFLLNASTGVAINQQNRPTPAVEGQDDKEWETDSR